MYFFLFVILKNIPELQSKPCRFLCYPYEYVRITLKTTLNILILKPMLEVSSELLWRFWYDRLCPEYLLQIILLIIGMMVTFRVSMPDVTT